MYGGLSREQGLKRQELERKKYEVILVNNINDFDVDIDIGVNPDTGARTYKRFKANTSYKVPRWLAIIFVKQCFFKHVHERNITVLSAAKKKWNGSPGEFHTQTASLAWSINDQLKQNEILPRICEDETVCKSAYPQVVENKVVVEELAADPDMEEVTDKGNGTSVNLS